MGFLIVSIYACITPQVNQEESLTNRDTSDSLHLAKGREITGAVFSSLSGELMASMKRGGVKEAIGYCKLQAYPITDSLAEQFQAMIKRTSHSVRNPMNAPDSMERKMIDTYLDKQIKGEALAPVLEYISEDETRFYAPIILAPPCMQCHGEVNKDISPANYELIQKLYPDDKAVGFSEGDLRGIWSIQLSD